MEPNTFKKAQSLDKEIKDFENRLELANKSALIRLYSDKDELLITVEPLKVGYGEIKEAYITALEKHLAKIRTEFKNL